MNRMFNKAAISIFMVLVLFSCATNERVIEEKSWENLGRIFYGDDQNQYVEMTVPKRTAENVNVILYIHGYSNRMTDLTLLDKFQDSFIIGKLNYRYLTQKSTDLTLDELLSDVNNGIIALKNKADENGMTINKCIIMGESLGGMLSLMYSYTLFDKSPIPIAFCVSLAGQADWTDATIIQFANRPGHWLNKDFIAAIGSIFTNSVISKDDITEMGISESKIETFKQMSPIYYVNEKVPPTIIVHDTNDDTAPFSGSVSLNHVLNVYNIPHIFIQSVTNSGHTLGVNSASNSTRKTKVLHPLIEKDLNGAMNQYIGLYCQ